MRPHVSTHSALSQSAQAARRLRWARRSTINWVSLRYRGPPRLHLHHSENSLPTSAVNVPSLAHICGDIALSHLDGFAQRMFFSQKTEDHRESVAREGFLSNIYYDPLLGHNDQVCSDFVGFLARNDSFTYLLDSKCQSGIFCAYKKNLSLRLIWDTRRSNQHFRIHFDFSMATGDSFSRVELLNGNPDGSGALALHIASGDDQNACHYTDIPEWLRSSFCLRPLSAFRKFVSPRSKSCSLRHSRYPWCFPGACSFVSMSASSRRVVRISR